MGLVAASGKHNACEEVYEQGKREALSYKEIEDCTKYE